MASQADRAAQKSYEVVIVQVFGLPQLRLAQSVKAHVQVDSGNVTWRTQEVKWKNGGGVRWDEKSILPPLAPSEQIEFTLIRDHRIDLFNKSSKASQGSSKIKLAELLQASGRRPNEDTVLSLQENGKETCKLAVRIIESSATALSSTIERLEGLSETLTAPGSTAVTDAMSAAGDAVTALSHSDIVGSFEMLVNKLGILVMIGDEIAKIHPWVNLAWNVLSVGLKLVKAQQDRDHKITALIETMQSIYYIVVGSEILKDERLQDVLIRILKQTVDCGFFIQECTRGRTFAGKAITEAFSNTDGMLSQYEETFKKLREEYTGRIATQTAVVTSKTAVTVDIIRFDQVMEKLRPMIMDESKRGVCLPDTRLDAIKSITTWFSSESEGHESTMWVHGVAGTGKSTLSTTAARMMRDLDLLGAFFFFNRDLPESNASTLIRTLAYQLAQFDQIIGAKIEQIIKGTPNIASMTLAVQFSKLFSAAALGDVPWSRGPILVVIDALDEAGSATEREDLIKVLSQGASKLPWFLRLLIVSRRERDIWDGFKNTIVRLEELRVDSDTAQADITVFIRSQLYNTRERNLGYLGPALENWPGEDNINDLVHLASGHFIWADTACRLIHESDNPQETIDELINDQSISQSGELFESLHRLYKTALLSAGRWQNTSTAANFRDILGAVICAQIPLSCSAIDSLLLPRMYPLQPRSPSLQTVSRFGSVLNWSDTGPTRLLHTSFFDYLTAHAPAEPWAINVEECDAQLAKGCILLLEKELRENMCNLTLSQPVQNETLPETVAYASEFWIDHVCLITDASEDLAGVVYRFMCKHLLHWIEALIIMGAYDKLTWSLSMLLEWTQTYFPGSKLYPLVYDAHRFVQYFANTICEHPLLIYASAVPFTPHNTLLYKMFHHTKLPHVLSGIELTWPPLLQVLYGHEGRVFSVAFSPDGSYIVSGSRDKTVRVWDAITGQIALPPLEGHKDGIYSVSFSPDGSKIVSGSYDKTVRVWDAITGQAALPPLEGHEDWVYSVSFSPDGSNIVSGSKDKTVRVWSAITGRAALPPLEGHKGPVYSVALSPDGSKIVSGSYDKTVRVWDAITGQAALPPLEGHEDSVFSVAFSPDGSYIVSGSRDKTVRVWDATTGQATLPPLQGHEGWVWSVSFSPDGSKIVSGSYDKTVRVWDTVTGEVALLPLQGHAGTVRSVSFSPDGFKIVSGSRDKTVRVWDIALTGQSALPLLQGHKGPVLSTCFSPNGSKIVSGSIDKTVRVWDAIMGQAAFPPLEGHEDGITSVSFSPDGSKIVSCSIDKTVRVWDAITGQVQVTSPWMWIFSV
ncbi:WD40 repeat-like protein [Athelia psychrophila]|uniref:WD40 repeat-like protein n=1 Tax=Athelia psychrophila TaxID=1759441 RepID=A0A166TLJ3_9AGAM|nr:WD40 repeat-like protein [Fibularhizoctonia sp. CBS 109695]